VFVYRLVAHRTMEEVIYNRQVSAHLKKKKKKNHARTWT